MFVRACVRACMRASVCLMCAKCVSEGFFFLLRVFLLLTHLCSQAVVMRKSFVEFVLDRCQGDAPAWTPVQAEAVVHYFDKYWHGDLRIRSSFIDAVFLKLRFELHCPYTPSNGAQEGSHAMWDSIIMHGLQNKNVLNVVQKAVGMSMSGAS